MDENNAVIEFSTSAFELARKALRTLFHGTLDESTNSRTVKYHPEYEESGTLVSEVIKISNWAAIKKPVSCPLNGKCSLVNHVYTTKSSMLINGTAFLDFGMPTINDYISASKDKLYTTNRHILDVLTNMQNHVDPPHDELMQIDKERHGNEVADAMPKIVLVGAEEATVMPEIVGAEKNQELGVAATQPKAGSACPTPKVNKKKKKKKQNHVDSPHQELMQTDQVRHGDEVATVPPATCTVTNKSRDDCSHGATKGRNNIRPQSD